MDVELDGMHPSHIIQLSYLVITATPGRCTA